MAVQGKKATGQFPSSTTSNEDLKVYCQPCDEDGDRLPAHGFCTNCSEHLCETCFTHHKRHKLSRHHTLLDKTSMPQTLSHATPRQKDIFTRPCPSHNSEMIKYYCQNHNKLLCSVCVTLEHTVTSCNVSYIPDISGQIINSTDCQDTLKDINDMTERCSKTRQDMKMMNEELNKSLTDVLIDINKFRAKINKRLNELERQFVKTIKVIQENNHKNYKRVKQICRDVSKSLKSSAVAIENFNKTKQANDLFMELKQAEQIKEDYEQNVAKLSNFDVKKYKFEPNEAILNLLDKEKSIGTLKDITLNPRLKSRQCLHTDKICIKTSQDNKPCTITGMTLISSGLLILTDRYNKAIKVVDVRRRSVLDQQCFDSDPSDVTSVLKNELAVTFPHERAIQFLSVSGNNLKKEHTLKVDGKCYGISCHKDKMVVSFCSPAKVQILRMEGTVLQTIQDENIFESPLYITAKDNCIYVSDYQMKSVTKLNWQCKVQGKHDCTSHPVGLTMSDEGTVFVCCDNNTIEEISGDCTIGHVVVGDVDNPQAIYWSAEKNILFTSTWNAIGNREEDNSVKLFKLSQYGQ